MTRRTGPPEAGDLAGKMRPAADVVDLPALDVHAADEHRIGPGQLVGRGGRHILVDELDLPVLG